MSSARIINNLFLYNHLFTFVKRHTYIHEFVESIDEDQDKKRKALELLTAINIGNSEALVFRDSECYLFLLYLIKTNQIDFWHGMTVYFYLMALMQIDAIQPDSVKVQEIDKPFLEILCEGMPGGKNVLDELIKFVEELPAIERWVIKIPYDPRIFNVDNPKENAFDKLIDQIARSDSISFLRSDRTQTPYTLQLPSFSIIRFCLQKLSSHPIEPFVAFGKISQQTLNNLHKKHQHPVSIYAPSIKSNLLKVHNFDCGPFGVAIHDLGHVAWGSALPYYFREKIYDIYIPQYEKLREFAQQFADEEINKLIEDIIVQIGDFDLLSNTHHSETTRCLRYLTTSLEPFGYKTIKQTSGTFGVDDRYDRLYYLVEYMRLTETDANPDIVEFWKIMSETAATQIEQRAKLYFSDSWRITTAIRALASNVTQDRKELTPPTVKCDAIKWSELLTPLANNDSEQIWYELIHYHHYELLFLISHCNLIFFHPYLPLTAEKQRKLTEFIETMMQKTAETEKLSVADFGIYQRKISIDETANTSIETVKKIAFKV